MISQPKNTTLITLFVESCASLALSLILPFIIGWSQDLAGATAAALTFAGCYLLSLCLSLYLLGLTLLSLKHLTVWQKLRGFTPLLLVGFVGILLWSQMQ